MAHTGDSPIIKEHSAPTSSIGAEIGGTMSLADIRLVNKTSHHELPKAFGATTIGPDGSITIQPERPPLPLAPSFPLEPLPGPPAPERPSLSTFNQLQQAIERDPLAKKTTTADGRTVIEDSHGQTLTISPDGSKTFSSDNGNTRYSLSIDANGGWSTEYINRRDGVRAVIEQTSDGTMYQTVDSPRFHQNTTWASEGLFLQQTNFDKQTGKGTLTKVNANGVLETQPLPDRP
jgi:hypothetical protein